MNACRKISQLKGKEVYRKALPHTALLSTDLKCKLTTYNSESVHL
jgi:hypothetical protein